MNHHGADVDTTLGTDLAGRAITVLKHEVASRLHKITAWHTLTSVADMKSFLPSSCRVSTCFNVYSDSYNYNSGVYYSSSASLDPRSHHAGMPLTDTISLILGRLVV